jgi:hypothetical protein
MFCSHTLQSLGDSLTELRVHVDPVQWYAADQHVFKHTYTLLTAYWHWLAGWLGEFTLLLLLLLLLLLALLLRQVTLDPRPITTKMLLAVLLGSVLHCCCCCCCAPLLLLLLLLL